MGPAAGHIQLGFLTGVVLLVPDRDKLLDAARGISPITWLAALVLFLGGHVLMAFKWWLLMGQRRAVLSGRPVIEGISRDRPPTCSCRAFRGPTLYGCCWSCEPVLSRKT